MTEETKPEEKKDYYEILGVKKDCSLDELKKAYRSLAQKWYPDKHMVDKEIAEQKFKEIAKAFGVLSDPQKRQAYDNGEDEEHDHMDFDPFELFKHFTMMSGVPDVIDTVEVSLEELYNGTKKDVQLKRFNLCSKCHGVGTENGEKKNCSRCDGSGSVMAMLGGFMRVQMDCPECGGNGIDKSVPQCTTCQGKHCIEETITLHIDINNELHHKSQIHIENEGNEIPPEEQSDGKTRSDVVFIIKEKPHDTFKHCFVINDELNFTDLMMDLKITFAESITGFTKSFKHLDGRKIFIKNEKFIKHNEILVLENEGMIPNKSNMMIHVIVEDPSVLSFAQKQKIWQILTNSSLKPLSENDKYICLKKMDDDE